MSDRIVHVIDDDEGARDALVFMLSAAGLTVEDYPGAPAFLTAARTASGVLVTDVRMPEMDGMELVRRLHDLGVSLPVIVMTGHGDVPLAVEAMKAGVVDFIEKPYDDEVMLGAIEAAFARLGETRAEDAGRAQIVARIEGLSPRERQVMQGLVAGKANKVIAYDLDISQRTVETYRANVMTKMQAKSLPELVRMAIAAGLA
jgi:two-component system response regulator FixJ